MVRPCYTLFQFSGLAEKRSKFVHFVDIYDYFMDNMDI